MRTIAESGDELALRLCELVGANPDQTTTIALEGDHEGAVVRWECVKRVPIEDVSRVINGTHDDRPRTLHNAPSTFGYETRGPAETDRERREPVCSNEALQADTEPCQLVTGHSGWHANTRGVTWPDRK